MTCLADFPAPQTLPAAGVRLFGRNLLTPWRAWRRRRRLVRLLDQDDRMLDDIGVTRAEVEWAAGLPLARNAALDLHKVALERRRRERPWGR